MLEVLKINDPPPFYPSQNERFQIFAIKIFHSTKEEKGLKLNNGYQRLKLK